MGALEAKKRRRLGITGNPDYAGTPFTDFASVTRRTKVQNLNLNWRERDLPERERTKHVHRLHPYLGKFVPQLVEIFLRKYRPSTVLDPFCGSGTTLVEANALGINSVGCDISYFNCLLTRVKVESYDLVLLEREVNDVLTRLRLELHPGMFSNGHSEELTVASEYLHSWFAPKALQQLLYFRSLIADYEHQELLQIVLSRAARSARLTMHFNLDFPAKPQTEPYDCRKHSRVCKPTDDAEKFLVRYGLDTLQRMKAFAKLRSGAVTSVVSGNSQEFEFPQADLVITSPPYVGLIDYHEQHRYAFELLGLTSREQLEIGAARRGVSKRVVDSYVDDMTAAFKNTLRALQPGGRMVVIVHDRRQLYDEIARRLNVQVDFRLERHVNRRTGRRAGDFFESVIVWRKT